MSEGHSILFELAAISDVKVRLSNHQAREHLQYINSLKKRIKSLEKETELLMDEMRVWTCENGHVMGLVTRNGSGVRQLLIYRHALDMSDEAPEAPEVMAAVEGIVFDIQCSICGSVRTWFPSQEALERLLARAGHGANIS